MASLLGSFVLAAAPLGASAGARAPEGGALERVLVRLDTRFRPEGELGRATRREQRASIREVRRAVLDALAGSDHLVVRTYRTVPYVALAVDAGALARLRASPLASRIHEDRRHRALLQDSAPLVEADDMAAAGFDGTGQTVAVLDTGVDGAHPFLAGSVVEAAEACFASTASGGGGSDPGNCPNDTATQLGPGSGVPCEQSACDHGTHVAGIAAGGGDPLEPDLGGMAPGAGILPVQVFSADDDGQIGAWDSDLIKAMEHVVLMSSTYEIAAVNMSLGSGVFSSFCDGDPLKPSIDNLRSAEIAPVIASGNDESINGISAPACVSTAVSVGSTTKGDGISGFSNSDDFLSLLAPGSDITSSIPGDSYDALSGTSMATPHVAGAWALLREAHPTWSVDRILGALQNTGLEIEDVNFVITSRILVNQARDWAGHPHDDFESATVLPVPGQDSLWNVDAGVAGDEPSSSCGPMGRTVWYSITPTETGPLEVSTDDSQLDTLLAVWTGSTVATLTEVACNDDVSSSDRTSLLTLDAEAGETYHVQVGGWNMRHGRLSLSVSPPSPPAVEPPPPPQPAPSGPTTFDRSVKLRLQRHLKAKGRVRSPGGGDCVSGVEVDVQRRRAASWRTVDTTTTRPNGRYGERIPDRNGRYRASVDASNGCEGATSNRRRHRD